MPPQLGNRHLDTEPQKAQRRLGQDGLGQRKRAVHRQVRQDTRENVAADNPRRAGAQRVGGIHVLLLAE